MISSTSQCRSLREQRRKFYQVKHLCAFSPATHQPRNPQTPYSTSTRKRKGRKQGVKVKHSGHSPSHFCSDKPTSSRTSMVTGLTQPHAGCTATLLEGTCGSVAASHFPRESEESSPHALGIETWPEGLLRPGDGVHQMSPSLLAALLAFSTSTQNQRNGWLFNKSKPVSFFKLKFHRSSAYPMARCPQRRWKNNWNHMSQFD